MKSISSSLTVGKYEDFADCEDGVTGSDNDDGRGDVDRDDDANEVLSSSSSVLVQIRPLDSSI